MKHFGLELEENKTEQIEFGRLAESNPMTVMTEEQKDSVSWGLRITIPIKNLNSFYNVVRYKLYD